jgi:localization factor PodJL
MAGGAPWSVKGIDPKAREAAKDLARQNGMTLGEWLNRMILEDDTPEQSQRDRVVADDRGSQERFGRRDDEPLILSPALETASRPLGGGQVREPYYIETPRGPLGQGASRFEAMGEAPPRYEIPPNPSDEVGQVTQALDRLSARIEASEARSTLAISGVEQSVRGALARLDGGERESNAIAARFEGAVQEVQSEQMRIAERLRRIEQEASGPRSVEALRALEGALGKVAGHLYEGEEKQRQVVAALEARIADVEQADRSVPAGLVEDVVARVSARLEVAEARTSEALKDLGASFHALDSRLGAVEGAGGQRLEALAAELAKTMQDARSEMAAKLADTSDGRFDRVERKLSEMTAHVTAAEARSAQAIERMGREVVNMADNLSRRVQGVEANAAQTAQKIGGEMARIAQAVESRLGHADSVQAQAMEKLGAEIARITERLAERIANAERRSALAIDDVGEQVARVTERINQRNERTATDLAERIRQSEERTAKLLDEAREKIDASLANTHRKLSEQVASAPASVAAADASPPKVTARSPFDLRRPFGGESIPEETFEPRGEGRASFGTNGSFGAEPVGAFPIPEPQPLAFSDEDFEAADGFAPIPEAAVEDAFIDAAPPPAAAQTDFARTDFAEAGYGEAAFAEPPHDPAARQGPLTADLADDIFAPQSAPGATPARPQSTRDVIEQARAAARASAQADPKAKKKPSSSLFGGFGAAKEKKAKKKGGNVAATVGVVLVGSLTVGALVAYGMIQTDHGLSFKRLTEAKAVAQADRKGEITAKEPDTTPGATMPADPQAAVMLAPQTVTPGVTPGPGATLPAATGLGATSLYEDGVRRIEAHDLTGMDPLRKSANLGYAPAQFYLAKLYENGEGGLKKDPGEARRWTERAAQGGDKKAMHNLALYYFYGEGGAKNSTVAAQWFRKAADLGLVDSQYNLGRLYEQGLGVSQNAAEAYKWYLIASRKGDTESRNSAARVRDSLSPEARATAERAASAFRSSDAPAPAGVASPASISTAPAALVIAQKALSKLGYYQGPEDGTPSRALTMAIGAWQRDQGMNPTGELDATAVTKLSQFAK